jgi:transposase
MLDKRTIFEIHRLANEGFSQRRIARELRVGRKTVKKYLENPEQTFPQKSPRPSKLDPYQDMIGQFLEQDPQVHATVLLQRLQTAGFDGKIGIVRDYLHEKRGRSNHPKAFVRFESPPGHQFQIDWGHFGSIQYGNTRRRLYCMAVIESHSRLLYLEFTHSQRQETLHRCLLNAFSFFEGTPRELVTDNMLTAVIERDGSLIRFNDSFLEFLRPFAIVPRACNVRSPYEKGKVEKGAIHYIRYNFFPLRSFDNLKDLQHQAGQWRDHVANIRIHSTTGQRPIDRFKPEAMRPLPPFLPDCRDTASAKVYSDFSVRFDANNYTVPPWAIGRQVIIKADTHTLSVYLKNKAIATHTRSYKRKERIELPAHIEAAQKQQRRFWQSQYVRAFISLGEEAKIYLEHLTDNNQPIKKTLKKLLALEEEYGSYSLIEAIKKATLHNAYGAHYIQNILYQEMTPKTNHPPVRLKDDNLNNICLEKPALAEYDTLIIKRRKNHDSNGTPQGKTHKPPSQGHGTRTRCRPSGRKHK